MSRKSTYSVTVIFDRYCHGHIWQMRRTDKKNLNVWIWSAFSWSIMKGFFKSTLQQIKMKYITNSRKQYYRDVSNKANLLSTRHPYFQLRDEMLTQYGFIFKGDHVFISLSLWSEFKRVNHSLHTGINGWVRQHRVTYNCWLFFELEDNATSIFMRKLKSRFASYGISDAGPSLRPRHLSTFQRNYMLNISWKTP